ncbi:MAG: cation transporter [Nanoarchaeota archaeon]|nr:cation transporter [Nanoarchaeota archaeon]
MVNKKLKVKGMHCPSCEMLIKDILEDEGVKVLSVNHKTGDLEISYNEKTQVFENIKNIISWQKKDMK